MKPKLSLKFKLTELVKNNLVSIQYEYFIPQSPLSTSANYELQRLETKWRQDGKLVYYDPVRNLIWAFRGCHDLQQSDLPTTSESLNLDELQALSSFHREVGVFEPASLTRNKNLSGFSNSSSNGPSGFPKESVAKNPVLFNQRTTYSSSTTINKYEPTRSCSETYDTKLRSETALVNEIYEYFISAVVGSIMSFLCRNQKYVPFNSRTLILASSPSNLHLESQYAVEFATLDANLTSMGTLVIKIYYDVTHFFQSLAFHTNSDIKLDNPDSGAPLWLAPGGSPAHFYSSLDAVRFKTSDGSDKKKIRLASQAFKTAIKSWQKKCLEWLSFKGLDPMLLDSCGWSLVQIINDNSLSLDIELMRFQILDDLGIIAWPSLLCFQNLSSHPHDLFGANLGTVYPRDPLSFAEEWFKSQEERMATLNRRQHERNIAEALMKERVDFEARAAYSNLNSPEILRRVSLPGTIYPTPPDALHNITAKPLLDGNSATPGNSNSCVNIEATKNISGTTGASQDNLDNWALSGKKERVSSDFNFSENYTGSDNLFGDLNEEIFGNDVTDADFNFFDEPDVVPMELEPTSPSLFSQTDDQNLIHTEGNSMPDLDRKLFNTQEASNLNQKTGIPIISKESGNGRSTSEEQTYGQGTMQEAALSHLSFLAYSSPFDKESVFKKIKGDFCHESHRNRIRKYNVYDKVDFSQFLNSVNEKYGASGRFKFSVGEIKGPDPETLRLPQIKLLKKRQKKSFHLAGNNQKISSLFYQEPIKSPLIESCHSSVDSDNCNQSSGVDTDELNEAGIYTSRVCGIKRGFLSDENDEIVSPAESPIQAEDPDVLQPTSLCHIPLLNPDPADWPLMFYTYPREPDSCLDVLTDLEYIGTTQILADQAISGIFKLPGNHNDDIHLELQKSLSTRRIMQSLTDAAKHYFKEVHVCSFRNFLDVQGIHVSNQVLRLPPRPNTNLRGPLGSNDKSNNLFSISLPQVEVRRSESSLSVLPAAVTYWENLGLSPSAGPKNIEAVCVHPDFDGVAENASLFLDRMRSVYESSRFGSHQRILSKDLNDGLVPFSLDSSQSKISNPAALKEATGKLSRVFSCLTSQSKNLVVYFAYIVDDSPLVVHICSAFQHLFSMYRKSLLEKRAVPANEIVLQLVPLGFIASQFSLAVPKPSEYFGLAHELYDRCLNFVSSSSTPAIVLERSLPKSIDFKLNSNSSASLLHENTCVHIAYAQSIDGRWITAAWTDNRGSQQLTASYCLRRKNGSTSISFSKIASEIWATTSDFISVVKIHRRIIIAKVGVMYQSEIESWTSLASTQANSPVNLILVTTQSEPSLRLLPTPFSFCASSACQTPITPGSANKGPPPSIWSPENTSDTLDVSNDPGINSRLIDYTDQIWGAILSHRLSNSNSLLEFNLALISGYLIKRGGTKQNDPPLVMEINIIYGEIVGNPRTYHENLLKEILGYYRGLGTLARVRGIVDAVRDIRPWHIAAVEKAMTALYTFM